MQVYGPLFNHPERHGKATRTEHADQVLNFLLREIAFHQATLGNLTRDPRGGTDSCPLDAI